MVKHMLQINEDIKIPERRLKAIQRDAGKTAEEAHLVYVTNQSEGIERVKKGRGFQLPNEQ